MQVVVAALDQHVREGKNSASLPELLRARNAVQYHLLCVRAGESISDTGQSLFDICRLGLLIFSNMVLFPLPTESGVAEMLVGSLRERLLESQALESHVCMWSQHADFLTWIVVLGSMAATATSHSHWYTQCLADIILGDCPQEWHHLENTTLSRYAWWNYTCSSLGHGIWLGSILSRCKKRHAEG